MAEPIILIEQAGQAAGHAGQSRTDLVTGSVVTATDTSGNGTGTYTWIVDPPPGVALPTLTGAATDTLTFTPVTAGGYLIYLQFDTDTSWDTDADDNKTSAQGGASVLWPNGTQGIGDGESDQHGGYPEHQAERTEIIDNLRVIVEGGNSPATISQPQTWVGNQAPTVVTLTDAANIAIDASASNFFKVTLTADRQLDNPTNFAEGMTWIVKVTQDGAGLHALAFDTYYDWGDGTAPDFSTDPAATDALITCVALSATKIRAVATLGV